MHDVSGWLFVAASIVLIVTPGQDMILVMSRSIAQGSAAGVATAAGVSVGLVGHTLMATMGLGAILRTSEWLFVLLKLVGATYLVYLGIQLLRTRSQQLATAAGAPRSLARLFVDGAVSNVSNPKIAIFYFAFLPQFVAPDAQHPTAAVFALGGLTPHEGRNAIIKAGAQRLGDREVLMLNMTRDEYFDMPGALDLFEAIPGPKRMGVWPGGHTDIGPEAIKMAVDFFKRTLA